MSKLDDIGQARKERDEAERRLRRLVAEAVADSVPLAKVARAAGVTRATMYRWLETKQTG